MPPDIEARFEAYIFQIEIALPMDKVCISIQIWPSDDDTGSDGNALKAVIFCFAFCTIALLLGIPSQIYLKNSKFHKFYSGTSPVKELNSDSLASSRNQMLTDTSEIEPESDELTKSQK